MSQARNIPPGCLVLKAVKVGVAGGGKGLQQSCPSLGNAGGWESSSGGNGAKEGPGWQVLCIQLLW